MGVDEEIKPPLQKGVAAGREFEEGDARDQGLSIVVPAYNEKESIGLVIADLTHTMSESGLSYEVIIVDDGSDDGTGPGADESDHVRWIHHDKNRGYGAAIKTGIRYAKYNIVCITDADSTYPNQRIPELFEILLNGGCEMVVGARSAKTVAIPLIRKPAKWFIGRLAELMAGRAIPDLNSGLRLFRRKKTLQFFRLLPNGFSFTSTITLAMINNGYKVDFVPIEYQKRMGRSKIRPIRDTFNFVILVLRISLCFAPLKIFLPLSGFMFLMAIGWGLFSKFVLGELADTSTMILAVAALQTGLLGLLADLIDRRLPNAYREED